MKLFTIILRLRNKMFRATHPESPRSHAYKSSLHPVSHVQNTSLLHYASPLPPDESFVLRASHSHPDSTSVHILSVVLIHDVIFLTVVSRLSPTLSLSRRSSGVFLLHSRRSALASTTCKSPLSVSLSRSLFYSSFSPHVLLSFFLLQLFFLFLVWCRCCAG